jgi:NAD(P)-dependent dehydrogenase (short-subunit alcohol dehydrogenase family)
MASAGGECLPLEADLLRLDEIDKTIGRVVAAFGRLDVLVNSAGVFELCDFLAVSEASYDRTLGVNLKGLFFMSQRAARLMKSQGKGKIINIASEGGGVTGFSQGSVYCASKGAIVSLTQALALELAPYHINVNAISPGTIRTPMNEEMFKRHPEFLEAETKGTPCGRLGTVDEVAAPVAFLLSDEASFITASELMVDGGYCSLGPEGLGEASTFAGSA